MSPDKKASKTKTSFTMLCHKSTSNRCIINRDSNIELKETNIKNGTCYHIDDILKLEES